jgi:hypothetical protein
MRFARATTRGCIVLAGIVLWAPGVWGQDPSAPSLGDVARKTRKEHSASDHVPASRVAHEDEDGPDSGGVWRLRLCLQSPCYEISVTLPKSPKWTRPESQPRPVLIPLAGQQEDPSHAIRVYAAEAIPRSYGPDGGTRTFLQGWFARPEYFGQAARIVLRQHVLIDGSGATIAHFTVTSGVAKYRGLSVVAVSSYGDFGFACMFREEDASAAASVCDAIVTSARTQTLQAATPRMYPTYPQPYDPPYQDPPDDPTDNDDPE